MFPGATVVWRGVETAAANSPTNKGKSNPLSEGRRLSVSSLEELTAKRQKLSVSADASRTRRPGVHPSPPTSRPESRGSTKSEGAQPSRHLEVESVEPRSEDAVVTDLFLIIHGIGQGVRMHFFTVGIECLCGVGIVHGSVRSVGLHVCHELV